MTPGDMRSRIVPRAGSQNCQNSYGNCPAATPARASPMTPMQPTNLRCEYFVNPIGIDAARPRLSWQIDAPKQSAYQVIVEGMWDSGKVESDRSIHVEYDGPALRSTFGFNWKVRIWDGDGNASAWSEAGTFEMGLLNRTDWQAKWIGSHLV